MTTTGFSPSSCSSGVTSFHSGRFEYGIHSFENSSSELSAIFLSVHTQFDAVEAIFNPEKNLSFAITIKINK